MGKEVFEIIGGQQLVGKTRVYSAKNAVLPMLAGAMLTKEEVTILDCPFISDIDNMFKIRDDHRCRCAQRANASLFLLRHRIFRAAEKEERGKKYQKEPSHFPVRSHTLGLTSSKRQFICHNCLLISYLPRP